MKELPTNLTKSSESVDINLSVTKSKNTLFSFDQIFPESQQRQMGLHKLSEAEKEALHAHVETLLIQFNASARSSETERETGSKDRLYAGVGATHWIKDITEETVLITLEDGSLWQIDPFDEITVSLWLPGAEIMVVKSRRHSTGYNYLLINEEEGENAHARYLGQL